jgi:amino acid adenylation domain-containing protein
MAGHWSTLIEAATSDPALRVSDLPLLTDSEQRQFLEWNSTRCEYPRDRCIHDLFDTQCERTPNGTAVICGKQRLTYKQLTERSNRVASYLQKLGVGPGDPVGVCLERSLDMVVGLIAILKAGGAYVPMDPSYPSERLAFMLGDSKASIVLTQHALIGRFSKDGIQQICLDTDWDTIALEKTEVVSVHVRPEDPAYVMYTSGSTGRPKGVVGTHRSTVNRMSWMWREYPFQADDVCCQKTSLSFVDSIWEVFGPLLAGVPSVIIPEEAVKDMGRLGEILAANRVTRIVLVPSLLRAILSHSNDLHQKLPALKLWISSGEALSHDLAQRFFDRMPGRTLLNLYGSTEVAADATYYEVGNEPRLSSVPIGRPIANTQAYVLDRRRHLVPLNVQGEIYIGGDAVARGYLDRPDLTAEKFVPDPFSADHHARLYRTGDLGRYLVNGNIEYVGRSDHQVKVRGYRIELGEIESALGRHPAVRQCVVVAREDASGDKRLVAYYERTPNQAFTTADLRTALRAQLPEYMIPAVIIAMEKLPLTPNGKIDRKALPRPGGQTIHVPTDFVASRDPLEQMMVQIWAKVLGVNRIDLDSDFFDLGGHSLAAVRMLSEVEKIIGKPIPLATLFQASTVRAFAELLRKDGWTPSWSSLVPIQPNGPRSPLFLVHGAEGNVLLYRYLAQYLGSDQPVYGLQSQGLNGDGRLNTTIQEMATQYVKEVMTVQPHGPYLLGGYCLGGMIAFEMAQQISALGEKVALVLMLDTYNPSAASHFQLFLKAPLHFLQNVWFHGANLALIRSKDRKKFFIEKVDIELTRLMMRMHAVYQFLQRAFGGMTRNNYPHLAIKKINDQAWLQYVPQPYDGRVVLIRSKGHFVGFANPSFGWNGVVRQGLELHELPSYPKGMLVEPFCRLLAETLKMSLQNVNGQEL